MIMSICSTSQAGLQAAWNLFPLAGIVGAMLIGIIYALSIAFSDEKMKIWVKTEIWNLAMNFIVLFFTFGMVSFYLDPLTSGANIASFIGAVLPGHTAEFSSLFVGDCLYDVAYKYSLALFSDALKLSAIMTWSNAHLIYITNIGTNVCTVEGLAGVFFCLLGAPTVQMSPFSYAGWAQSLVGNHFNNLLLTSVFVVVLSQAVLLKIFLDSNILILASFLLVLKIMPFTKQFANATFAFIFAFLVFYPMIVVLEAPILGTATGLDEIIKADGVSIKDATQLDEMQFGYSDVVSLLAIDTSILWQLKGGTGTEICLYKLDSKIFCVDDIIKKYAEMIFRIVLFGSINLIIVQLVVKTLLTLGGDSDNLMEMFIRMGGVVSW